MKKNFFKKTVTLLLVATSLSLVACGGDSGDSSNKKVDANKTQLYVGVYDGGVGAEWAYKYAEDFERLYAEESFEEGKKGVQVFIDIDKEGFSGTTLQANMAYIRQDVFFISDGNYKPMAKANVLGDITNVVTGLNYDANGEWVGFNKGTTSLNSRLHSHFSDSLNVGTKAEPKYYALPNYSSPAGLYYDVDLFKEYGYLDYGNGPDGVPNTYDDGLPATWEEFKELIDRMVVDRLIPFTWCGFSQYYRNEMLFAFWAAYEGANDFTLNSTFSGVDGTLGEINESNAYLLQKQQGKLAALTAAYDMVSNPMYYSSKAFSNSQTHLVAQEEYVFSKETSARIAMFGEASWWENEAKAVFDDMGGDNAYGKREFSLLTLPRFIGTQGVQDQQHNKNTIYLEGSRSLVFTNAFTSKKALADEFVGFCHSASNLRAYTRMSGVPRAFDYTLTPDDLSAMTPMARNVWEIYSDSNTEKTYSDWTGDMRIYTGSLLTSFDWGSKVSRITSNMLRDPLMNFYTYGKNYNLTPAEYFAGLELACTASEWEELLDRYLGR